MRTPLSLILILGIVFTSIAQDQNGTPIKWTLKQCVDYAIENNITVKQNENNIDLAEIDKKDAIGNFIPTLNLNSSASWNRGLTQDASTGVLVNETTQTTFGGLSSGVPIYRGMRNQNQLID